MRLVHRWLRALGSLEPDKHALAARERSRRWPWPLPWLWPWAVRAIEWLAPLLLLGRWQRASALDDEVFERLEQKLHHHRLVPVRGTAHLVRMPLWDALAGEVLRTPTDPAAHPLLPRLAVQTVQARDFDAIVVGSGAGGAPVAWQLARAGLRVALLEAGGVVVPQPPLRALESAYLRQGMTLSMDGVFLPVLAGQGAGGTTVINSGTCLRPPPEWLGRWNDWAQRDLAAELQPWLDQAAEALGVRVPPRSLLGPSADRFEAGLRALGRDGAYVLPRNAPKCEGRGLCCFGCPSGAKRSTDRGFLPDALDAGLVLHLHTRVEQVSERPGDVQVLATSPDGPLQFTARHLVLAGGALQTPGLIRGSRLGRWQAAGEGLHVHPASKVLALFDDPVREGTGVPQGLGYQPPDLPRVVLEGIFTPPSALAPVLAAAGRQARHWQQQAGHLASFGLMLRDRTVGRVRRVGPWPVLRYRPQPDDVRDLLAGLRLTAETWLAAGARAVLLPLVGQDPEVRRRQDLDRLLRADGQGRDLDPGRLYACGFHPQGTAGIGRVVDADLRLTRRISVSDASVLPDTPGVNPQLVIVALGLRLGQRLAGELAR